MPPQTPLTLTNISTNTTFSNQYEVHNQITRLFSEEQSGPSMYIMWTHTSNTNKQSWHPNHFVSCHVIDETKQSSETASSGQFPLKKPQNIFDCFKCESHGNEPHSTNSQRHGHTQDNAEMPNNSKQETVEKPDGEAAYHQTNKGLHRLFMS